ncbi:MAG: ATP-binding protein [Clostridia bacterium]|nr:ATP-binding protein [Clostridia bacterium]
MELNIKADKSNLGKIFDFVNYKLSPYSVPDNIIAKINISVEEIFVNIANYAYENEKGEVTIECSIVNDLPEIEIIFIDSGKKFNPLKHIDPDTTLMAEDREIGGLGILLTKKLMDDVSYEYKDGKNVLKIVKKLN